MTKKLEVHRNPHSQARFFFVLPCFNESTGLRKFIQILRSTLSDSPFSKNHCTFVMVDDGSSDSTWKEILDLTRDTRNEKLVCTGIRFSRNFGHQAAICAGLDHIMLQLGGTDTDLVVVMDSDGQHPPQFVPKMLSELIENDLHHVQMVRSNGSNNFIERVLSRIFYKLFSSLSGLNIPNGAADFRAFSGLFLKKYLVFSESVKFNRGLFYWLGFETKFIPYTALERISGTTSYTFLKRVKLAFTGLTYFSSKPLTSILGMTTGFGFLVCLFYGIVEVTRYFSGTEYAAGWPTLLLAVWFWGSLLSLGQFMIAIYLSRVFDEVKKRPGYVVQEIR